MASRIWPLQASPPHLRPFSWHTPSTHSGLLSIPRMLAALHLPFRPARVLFLCLVHSCLAGFSLDAALWGPSRKQPLVSLPCVFPSQHSSPLSSEWRKTAALPSNNCSSPACLLYYSQRTLHFWSPSVWRFPPRQAILYDTSWCPTI